MYIVILLLWACPVQASHVQVFAENLMADPVHGSFETPPHTLFRQHIPAIARQFVGLPLQLGGVPARTQSADNSSLFYSIYEAAARKAGLTYKAYLPMKYLLMNTKEISKEAVQNGDLIVLENGLAAMIYQVEPSGRLHMIYTSKKRNKVFSFHSDTPVYSAYWLEHLKGYFTLKPEMLSPAR